MIEDRSLSISQRIVAVIFYLLIFLSICRYFNGNWSFLVDSGLSYNLLFVSGALLLIFGTYIAEPYFTKPIDVITNSTAVILALLTISEPENFIGFQPLFYSSFALMILAVLLIFFSNFQKIQTFQKIVFKIITELGQSKIVFSIIYLFTIVSYFRDNPIEFFVFLTFWLILISKFFIEKMLSFIGKLFDYAKDIKKLPSVLGEAIGCENPFLYKVEVDYNKHKVRKINKGELVYLSLDKTKGVVGIIINEKQLLNKKWLTVYLLKDKGNPLIINLKTNEFSSETKTIYSKDNAVYSLDISTIECESKTLIENNYLYKNKDRFIGYVTDGSDINKIKFHSLIDTANTRCKLLKEGSVIMTEIYGVEDVLYQIIDGKTGEEQLEKHNTYGYLTGMAQKLGRYDEQKKELITVKWLPDIYSPVFFNNKQIESDDPLSMGKLPETNFQIALKNPDTLVTHNTAILGILGIGKSCLTFELIQKVINSTNAKVVCIDITNEYKKELIKYINPQILDIDEETVFNELNEHFNYIHKEKTSDSGREVITVNYDKSGNQNMYRQLLSKDLCKFLFETESIPLSKEIKQTKRIRIYNPDYHMVSKGEKIGFGAITTDLTQAEKTRLITEEVFKILRSLDVRDDKAKILIVFEEAHSLVPEWNSTANEGDKSAVNGTAKVILQGRKYGLGSFVVTQRTANISKSILNQCNTIFALRVFDDTGKQFLENYIGSDYSNTLPTLEERYAIAVGKSLKLKQPVIIQLNDKDSVMIRPKDLKN